MEELAHLTAADVPPPHPTPPDQPAEEDPEGQSRGSRTGANLRVLHFNRVDGARGVHAQTCGSRFTPGQNTEEPTKATGQGEASARSSPASEEASEAKEGTFSSGGCLLLFGVS